MENIRINFIKTIYWITDRRNSVFLIACLAIHAFYAYLFYSLGIYILMALNICSCCFYCYYLFLKRDTSEDAMLSTYFEILLFSVLSELALGSEYGFFLYIIGMSATVFYLLPSFGNKRFLYQSSGVALVLVLEYVISLGNIHFEQLQKAAGPYQTMIFLINIAVTATIVLAAGFFYSKEIENVWDSLNYNTNHDVLTNLYNRRFFENEIARISKITENSFVICMLDIDFFKKVNDTYGHEAGDAVLVEVAARISEAAGKDNLAVRWGGEEFILYFPDRQRDQVYPEIEDLRKRIEGMTIQTEGQEIHVTITAGIAMGLSYENYESTIKVADDKLYIGKQQGRNRVIV